MEVDCLPFKDTGYFSPLICEYVEQKEALRSLYHRYPNLENFKQQIVEKRVSYPIKNRAVLCGVLQRQYQNIAKSKATEAQISLLSSENTFTVVTGHQLNLFTGPLYFLYKIISTINLAKDLKNRYPENNFVPVYWMATEDHDFEEINYFNLNGKKLRWNKKVSGAVGRLDTEGLDILWHTFSKELGKGMHAEKLKELFRKAYLEHDTLADATRFLANALFGDYGLVILDADDKELKQLLVPYVTQDLLQSTAHTEVRKTIDTLSAIDGRYTAQVNPRAINYFYLKNNVRERIVAQDGIFYINDTDQKFTEEAILGELQDYPERFSPNVITRPLYQEVILPNLCYIGGGGEIAYWLLLKSYFDAEKVPFPILLLRNSALVIHPKQQKKIEKLNLHVSDLFLSQDELIRKKVREISKIKIDFTPQKKHLEQQFKQLYDLASQTDKSFLGAVKAQEAKQLKGLALLEKRLLKAQKRKLNDHVERIIAIQNELFPNGSLQERNLNFSELFMEWGDDLIPFLSAKLNPLDFHFLVLKGH
ncbi:bacillithiol biosynthesis cysteine-adding enzyme BshC [Arenibacter sp. GZD96]|uniref:bacillithiol biosynthesis cysteine-adding enzyme BshC n=1 Tax=Aurantibrevibacter litoralis TaxID=3106030 RepID=UPI002AFF1DC8|nr:bacillithiol biosynthesis cysteine-adding enzyme BshC [Arenibacter sp. GZD-96]MEA1784991.1 bacillithiol biosynthesis cysteine-adding enzyme BshC [Arenibacter sp. GZD-96]